MLQARAEFYLDQENWRLLTPIADLSKAVELKPEQANLYRRPWCVWLWAARATARTASLQRFDRTENPGDTGWHGPVSSRLTPPPIGHVDLAEKATKSAPKSFAYQNTRGRALPRRTAGRSGAATRG